MAMAGGKENATQLDGAHGNPSHTHTTLSHTHTPVPKRSINSRGQSQRVIDMAAKRRLQLQLQLQRGQEGIRGQRVVLGGVGDGTGCRTPPKRNWMRVQNAFSNTATMAMATTMHREMQMHRLAVQIHTYTSRKCVWGFKKMYLALRYF